MSDIDCIESDFAGLLAGSGIAGTLRFGDAPDCPKLKAMISEVTFDAGLEIGGMKHKRSFTATCTRKEMAAHLPMVGGLVVLEGDNLRCRITQVRSRLGMPLAEIDFEER